MKLAPERKRSTGNTCNLDSFTDYNALLLLCQPSMGMPRTDDPRPRHFQSCLGEVHMAKTKAGVSDTHACAFR